MESVNILLDRFAKTCYATKDKEIAARLHVRPSSISNWRHGTSKPEPESIEKMADAIGEPIGKWLAAIEAERARTAEAKRVWLRLAAALGTTAAVALTATPHASAAPQRPNTAYCVK